MTPSDDTNCNAYLPAGTASISISVSLNQSGGTYLSGTTTPLFAWGLFKYNPAANTGTLITFGNLASTSWDATPVTGDLGTFKTITMSANISSPVEFAAGEVLLLQLGFNTQTIPNPTLGTATWVYTLAVDDPNTNLTWASGQGIHQVCYIGGAASGSGDASGVLGIVLPTAGAADGASAPSGVLGAFAGMVGSSDGSSAVSGALSAVAGMIGAASGDSLVAGVLGATAAMAGSADGASDAAGVLGAVAAMTGTVSGDSQTLGVLGAIAGMVGVSDGASVADGFVSSIAGTIGDASGASEVDGRVSRVLGTVGTVEPEGSSTIYNIRPVFVFDD